MKAIKQDYQVLVRLITSSWIATEGVRVERTLSGPIALWLKGAYLGIWWHEDGEYRFSEIAYTNPGITARTAEEAVAKTIAMVVRRRTDASRRRARDPWQSYSAASLPNWSSDKRA